MPVLFDSIKETELLPCPFCGGLGELVESFDIWFVMCSNGDCPVGPDTIDSCLDSTKEESTKAWNTRAK